MIALRGLHPEVRRRAEWAHRVAEFYGMKPVVTSGFRSMQEQQELRSRFEMCVARGEFRDGVTHGCQFAANRPGESAHNYGLAWDSWVPEAQRPAWQTIRQWAGFVVPGDHIHAEVPQWQQVASRMA